MKRDNSRLISEVIEAYVKEDGMEEGLLKARIFEAWDLLMAERVAHCMTASQASRLTVSRSYTGRTLVCRMGSSVARTQLSFQADILKDRLNALLQGDYIDKVVLL